MKSGYANTHKSLLLENLRQASHALIPVLSGTPPQLEKFN
jgi:hypothetical protein